MTSRFFEYMKIFGIAGGLKVYINRKAKRDSTVTPPSVKFPVHLRHLQTRSDHIMYEQIFTAKDYAIDVPFEPKIIIDLGANVGFASVYFISRFENAKIFAIEPDSNNYAAAVKNLEPYKNVTVVHGAAWNKPEQISIVDKGFGEASFMIEAGDSVNAVRAYTIKEVMQLMDAQTIDILKIDIEGSEKEIFESGYEEWLPATKMIIVETHDRYRKGTSRAVFNTISKYDFSLEISGENLVFYNNSLITEL